VSLFAELKRRNVVRVGIAYVIVAWLLLQVADLVLENINAPDWVMQAFMLAVAIGFPLVLLFAWAFEMTPEGLKRESEIDRSQSIAPQTGRKLDRTIIGVLALAVVFLLYQQFSGKPSEPATALLGNPADVADMPTEPVAQGDAEKSIAVLPFRDMSAARDQAYFGEGIAEELLNALVKLEGLRVASRTSAFSLADEDLDIPAIADRLGVDHILEGSVRTSGRQVRVTAQLIDVSEDTHLWSETYDGSLDDIFQIQDEITAKITAAMKVQLGGQALAPAASLLTRNAEAYRLYLQGRHLWRQRNAVALNKAVQLFEQAVEMDPDFSRAWSNLGVAYLILADYDPSHDIEASFRRALAAADRALALNPTSTEARIIRANFLEFHCNVVGSAREYEAAIANDPDDPTARHWYAMVLLVAGRTQYAREQIEIARRLDPLITAITVVEALVLSSLGQYDRAIALIREAESLGFRGGTGGYEGQVLITAGRAEEGAEQLRQAAASEQNPERRRVLELLANAAIDPAQQAELTRFMGRARDATPSVARDYADLLAALGSPYLFTHQEGLDCPILGQSLWTEAFRTQRGSPEFFDLMERSGYVDFWREFGWPDDCASLDPSLAECPP
jgi:TolB-like protein